MKTLTKQENTQSQIVACIPYPTRSSPPPIEHWVARTALLVGKDNFKNCWTRQYRYGMGL